MGKDIFDNLSDMAIWVSFTDGSEAMILDPNGPCSKGKVIPM
jgi:hypothetical protein